MTFAIVNNFHFDMKRCWNELDAARKHVSVSYVEVLYCAERERNIVMMLEFDKMKSCLGSHPQSSNFHHSVATQAGICWRIGCKSSLKYQLPLPSHLLNHHLHTATRGTTIPLKVRRPACRCLRNHLQLVSMVHVCFIGVSQRWCAWVNKIHKSISAPKGSNVSVYDYHSLTCSTLFIL